jgi:hypothetical protein
MPKFTAASAGRLIAAAVLAAGVALPAAASSGSTAAPVAAARQDRHVNIINGTRHTMMQFFASNSGRDSWEEDILGSDVLPAGSTVRINIDDGSGACIFDFKAVFDDGDEVIKYRINVCEISSFTFTE